MIFIKKAVGVVCLFIAVTNAAIIRGRELVTHQSTSVDGGTAVAFATDGTCTVNGIAGTAAECTTYKAKSDKMAADMKQSMDSMKADIAKAFGTTTGTTARNLQGNLQRNLVDTNTFVDGGTAGVRC